MSNPIPVGTRIVFLSDLTRGATEDSPSVIFAKKNEFGTIVGHDCKEGYWVTWDGWPHKFGASEDEFKVKT